MQGKQQSSNVCASQRRPEVFDQNGNKVGPRMYADHDKEYLSVQISHSIIEGTREVHFTEIN